MQPAAAATVQDEPDELGDLFDVGARTQMRMALLESNIRRARAGDVLPLVEFLWGDILRAEQIIADPGIIERYRLAGLPFIILDDFQIDIITSLFDPMIREVYVKGNTGCGKGASAGIIVCVYFLIWNDAKIVISRDTHKRAVSVMFGEVAHWWRAMRFKPADCSCLGSSLVDRMRKSAHECNVVNPNQSEGFTGAHSPHVLFLFDEATAASLEPRFKLADTQCTKFLAMANPRTSAGRFKEAFDLLDDPDVTQTVMSRYGFRRCITVDGKDMLNVKMKRLEQPVGPPGGITIGKHDYQHGEAIPDDNWVNCFAHGRFMREDRQRVVIRSAWVADAVTNEDGKRYRELDRRRRERDKPTSSANKLLRKWFPIEACGLDVGASKSGDPSVLTVGGTRGIDNQFAKQEPSAGALVTWVIDCLKSRYGVDLTRGGVPIGIDAVGIGWGLTSLFRQRGVRVIEIRGNDPSDVDPKRYANKRAEMYGELGARLDTSGRYQNAPFILPDIQKLRQELTVPEKLFGADGVKYHITPKRKVPGMKTEIISIEERIGRSPDWGDSACYFYRALQCKGADLQTLLDRGFF
jgi:hypothetical protein